MKNPPVPTGDLAEDWKKLCDLWHESDCVLMAEIGPMWVTPPQHLACMLFADVYPYSKNFLIEQIAGPDVIVAAYAFKCLIRVADLRPADVPEALRLRNDTIKIWSHSHVEETTLGSFISQYFDTYEDQADLLEAQQRGLDYQRNVVLPCYEASARTNQLN